MMELSCCIPTISAMTLACVMRFGLSAASVLPKRNMGHDHDPHDLEEAEESYIRSTSKRS